MGVAKLPGGGNITGAGSDDETPVKANAALSMLTPVANSPKTDDINSTSSRVETEV